MMELLVVVAPQEAVKELLCYHMVGHPARSLRSGRGVPRYYLIAQELPQFWMAVSEGCEELRTAVAQTHVTEETEDALTCVLSPTAIRRHACRGSATPTQAER